MSTTHRFLDKTGMVSPPRATRATPSLLRTSSDRDIGPSQTSMTSLKSLVESATQRVSSSTKWRVSFNLEGRFLASGEGANEHKAICAEMTMLVDRETGCLRFPVNCVLQVENCIPPCQLLHLEGLR